MPTSSRTGSRSCSRQAQAPSAVSKADIQERLWPATFVQETNIAGLVAEIRRALQPAEPSGFIRTVYRFGYRFAGDVIVEAGAPPAAGPRTRLSLQIDRREIFLAEGTSIVGRSPDAAIQIDSAGVSRSHARIVVRGDAATLEDLGSKNGTFLNGDQLAAATALSHGDEIWIGPIRATFRSAASIGATETLPSPPVQSAAKKSR